MNVLCNTILSLVALVLSVLLYQRAGESSSLFLLTLVGLIHPDIGMIVAPGVILYFGTRHVLL